MNTVSVSELKARLSYYLREVRRGGEIQILDRGEPVARLVSIQRSETGHDEEHRLRLIGAAILRPGSGESLGVLESEPLELPVSLVAALADEREDRL